MSTEPKETTMTDQTAHDVTPEDMEHARSYVRHFLDATHGPDHTRAVARVLQALLPPPPRPTLADMTMVEREECRWMQADVKGHGVRYVVANVFNGNHEAVLISEDGRIEWASPDRVTPRRDLRRMEWPGDKKPAPAALPDGWRLADHPDYGRVVVTRPEPDADGEVVIIRHHPGRIARTDTSWCDPDDLTYIDGPEFPAPVPPNTMAVGSEWDDADALALACRESGRDQIVVIDKDGDVSVWGQYAGWWATVGYEPFTILHTGKGVDQ